MKIWKPNYAMAANTRKNKAFITEIVDRVFETETARMVSSPWQLALTFSHSITGTSPNPNCPMLHLIKSLSARRPKLTSQP
jgi:hypothetical protein